MLRVWIQCTGKTSRRAWNACCKKDVNVQIATCRWTVRADLTSREWAASWHVRVLLCDKLTVVLLVKKFPVLYSVGWFGAVCIVALSLYLVRRHINPFHLMSVVMWLHMWLYYCAQSCCDLKIVVLLLWTLSCRYCSHFRKLLCTLWYCAHSWSSPFALTWTLWHCWCAHCDIFAFTLYSYCASCPTVTLHSVMLLLCTLFTITVCSEHCCIVAVHMVIFLLCTLYSYCAHYPTITVHIVALLLCSFWHSYSVHCCNGTVRIVLSFVHQCGIVAVLIEFWQINRRYSKCWICKIWGPVVREY
jgi:hypothetical protein